MTTNRLAATALGLGLAGQGWPVFPLIPNAKQPIGVGITEQPLEAMLAQADFTQDPVAQIQDVHLIANISAHA